MKRAFYKKWWFWLIVCVGCVAFVSTLLALIFQFADSEYENTQTFILFWIDLIAGIILAIAIFRLENAHREIDDKRTKQLNRKDDLIRRLTITPELYFYDMGRIANGLPDGHKIAAIASYNHETALTFSFQLVAVNLCIVDLRIKSVEYSDKPGDTRRNSYHCPNNYLLFEKEAALYYLQVPTSITAHTQIIVTFEYKNISGLVYEKTIEISYFPQRQGAGSNGMLAAQMTVEKIGDTIDITDYKES